MIKKLLPAAIAAATLLMPIAGHAQVIVDGTVDSAYGAAQAVQDTPTNYGDNVAGTAAPSGGGSELDSAYGVIENGTLYVTVTGNLENNGNALNLFLDTGTGGQNLLNNPSTSYNGLANLNGFTFDSGVSPGYDLIANASGTTNFYADLDTLDGTGTSTYLGTSTTFGPGASGTLAGGINPDNILAALDDSNTAGVNGTVATGAAAVMTGAEFGIPLSAIGNPTGPIKIVALLAGGGNNGVSNQILGPSNGGLDGYPAPGTVNLANIAGNQYFTVTPAPEPSSVAALMIGALVLGGAICVRRRKQTA